MRSIIPVALVLILVGCATNTSTNTNTSRYRFQPIENAFQLSSGMTKQNVISIMGNPAKNEFDLGVEEWHYCKTGVGVDEFVTVYFNDGLVIAMKPYSVTLRDAGGATGSCEIFIKMGNYSVPSIVYEYRINSR